MNGETKRWSNDTNDVNRLSLKALLPLDTRSGQVL